VKAGIIAAGLGERFRAAGITTPKPLLSVAGRTLLERTIGELARAGASSVALIVNAEYPDVERYVRAGTWPLPIALTVKTTPNSMESFFTLEPALRDEPFLLTTVDAVTVPGALGELARMGIANGGYGTLAVTSFVDDEKPLWVRLDERRRITELGARAAGSGWVTSGAYFFFPEVYAHVAEARARGLGALRQFLALLIAKRHTLHGFPAGASVDVDRPEDVRVAEEFLRTHGVG
jgi:NDP-sugar pyrophosphorylase family protein